MQPKLVVITGPTASGKTALGVMLAQRLGGEVVSADSMQIYRGMDIGTAKPTPEEMQGSSFTRVSSLTRKATVDFAPPEMLTEDIAGIDALRKSPKIDVYATASVIYLLDCGRAPIDLEAEAAQSAAELGDATDSRGEKGSGKNAEATKRAFSPYRVKSEVAPARPVFAHAAAADIAAVVLCEPEVD